MRSARSGRQSPPISCKLPLGERDGEPITGRLCEWLAGAPIDIYVLRVATHTAAQYAIGHAKGDDYGAFLDSTRAWAGNLRAQGYKRVVAVLVSFQWSSPACGPPWERTDESRPPQRSAGAEIEATFLAERLARNPELRQYLEGSWLRRADPIARLDASVLGGAVPPRPGPRGSARRCRLNTSWNLSNGRSWLVWRGASPRRNCSGSVVSSMPQRRPSLKRSVPSCGDASP